MKIKEYLKDKLFAFIIFAAAWGMAMIFIAAFHVPFQFACIISVIFFLAFMFTGLWDFFRKKSFYKSIYTQLKEFDKKYLITEMLEKPQFYEGKLLCEILDEASKSMCENVSDYRRRSADFREFIELWVHEVKLPLSSLLLMTHNHKSELNSKFMEQLRKIDGYTDTVLYYARIDNAEKDYMIKEIPLKKAVSNTAMKYREDLLLHKVNLQTYSLDINVMTDGKWLEYILGQLFSNSMKYFDSNREPEISVFAEELEDRIVIHFKDNGIGITENDLPYIFEKSFTGENGRIHAKSTGIGLYICRRLCDKLGHKMEVRSIRSEYTEFLISFAKNDFYKMQ